MLSRYKDAALYGELLTEVHETYLAKVPYLRFQCMLGKDETSGLFPGGRGRGEMLRKGEKERVTSIFVFHFPTDNIGRCGMVEVS